MDQYLVNERLARIEKKGVSRDPSQTNLETNNQGSAVDSDALDDLIGRLDKTNHEVNDNKDHANTQIEHLKV